MKHTIFTLSLLLLTHLVFTQELPKEVSRSDFSIGKTIQIESAVLGEVRILNVYLPESYTANGEKKYPVIYLLDGSRNEDFIHISGIVQFGSFSWINRNPEAIVVGIANVDRKRDFTYPSQSKLDQEEFPTSGQSAKFIAFIANELQPFIDVTYRTNKNRTLIGQSLGGLLATQILIEQPELFNNYVIVSPSLWWDDERLLDKLPQPFISNTSVYIAVGKEGEVMERTANELFDKVNQKKTENTVVYFEFLEDKTHGDALHIAVYNAFELLFKSEN